LGKNHTFDWLNVKILDFESNYFKRLVSEMIYIKTKSNGLNSMVGEELAYLHMKMTLCADFIVFGPYR